MYTMNINIWIISKELAACIANNNSILSIACVPWRWKLSKVNLNILYICIETLFTSLNDLWNEWLRVLKLIYNNIIPDMGENTQMCKHLELHWFAFAYKTNRIILVSVTVICIIEFCRELCRCVLVYLQQSNLYFKNLKIWYKYTTI